MESFERIRNTENKLVTNPSSVQARSVGGL